MNLKKLKIHNAISEHFGHDIFLAPDTCPECGAQILVSSTSNIFCMNNSFMGGLCDFYRPLNGLEKAQAIQGGMKFTDKTYD